MRLAVRWIPIAVVVTAVLTVGVAAAQSEGDPERGGQLYVENCAMCHGVGGTGRIGANLEDFPGIQIEATMAQTIAEGVEGSVMPAWSQGSGGPLFDQDIDDIVAYITGAFAGTEPIAPLPDYQPPEIPPLVDVEGDPSKGAVIYRQNCFACHGDEGRGRFGLPLAKSWSGDQSAAYIRQVVADGIGGSTMPAWALTGGGPLSDDEIADVAAYLLSLSPVGTSISPDPPAEGPISITTALIIFGAIAVVIGLGLILYYRQA